MQGAIRILFSGLLSAATLLGLAAVDPALAALAAWVALGACIEAVLSGSLE